MRHMLRPLRQFTILMAVAAFIGLVAGLLEPRPARRRTTRGCRRLERCGSIRSGACGRPTRRSPTLLPPGSSSTRPARSSSTTRTRRLPRARVSCPRSRRRCRRSRQDGRTYTFQIRDDYAFSPPASRRRDRAEHEVHVRADAGTRRWQAARALRFFYEHRRGGRVPQRTGGRDHGHRRAGEHAHVHPDRAAGRSSSTLLAMPFTCAVPTSLPPRRAVRADPLGRSVLRLAAARSRTASSLSRNPNYTGPRPHRFDSIEYTFNLTEQEILQRVESGISDYTSERPCGGSAAAVRSVRSGEPRCGPRPAAVLRGPRQDCVGMHRR